MWYIGPFCFKRNLFFHTAFQDDTHPEIYYGDPAWFAQLKSSYDFTQEHVIPRKLTAGIGWNLKTDLEDDFPFQTGDL